MHLWSNLLVDAPKTRLGEHRRLEAHPLTHSQRSNQGPDLRGCYLDLHSGTALLGGTVSVVFLLALQELPEMVLKQESGIELPHGDLVI